MYSKLPRHPHVLVLMKDRALVRLIANIDFQEVLAEVEAPSLRLKLPFSPPASIGLEVVVPGFEPDAPAGEVEPR